MSQLELLESETTRHFREFHAKNPKVYAAMVRLARQAKGRGRTKVGIELLANVVRWEMWMNTTDPNSDFKLNSNYKPFYARLIMQQEPDLVGFFDTRNMWANGDFKE
jgi:hypothetical protein